MKAILVKSIKNANKTITGDVVRRGLGTITLVITDKNGSRSIKTFKESDYTVKIY